MPVETVDDDRLAAQKEMESFKMRNAARTAPSPAPAGDGAAPFSKTDFIRASLLDRKNSPDKCEEQRSPTRL
ncbi:hypothetical protein [Ensifer sp. YR511]|uniref:hypothetical protein n=1 Tax=Ensifer sp. YR511 TaxID=1855294 RepID=UPI000B7E8F79|nr:hypothetical protein [Ensifer sp. YR511]